MLRFCSGGENLLEYVFDIEISDTQQVNCTQIWPEDKADPSIAKSIEVFVFPDVCSIQSNMFFNFVLGDTAVEYHHGFVLYQNSKKAKCILTKFYYPLIFRHVLEKHMDDIKEFAENLNIPENTNSIQIDGLSFPLDGSFEKQRLYGLIFKTFSPYEITKIIIGMLEARHIFPFAANPSKLCQFSAALPLLLEPFRWNMNTIPILPTKLRDVTNVPVPTMIGLTHPEILLEGRVDNHIIVNIDTHRVIDNPAFDVNDPRIFDVLNLQLGFANQVSNEMKAWGKVKNFPYKHIQKIVRLFISEYLFIYSGRVKSVNDLVAALPKLPERLAESQVLHDLEQLDKIPAPLKQKFDDFFDEIFSGKTRISTPQKGTPKVLPKSASSSLVQESPQTSGNKPFDPFGIAQEVSTPKKSTSQDLNPDPFGFGSTAPSTSVDNLIFDSPSEKSNETNDLFIDFNQPAKAANTSSNDIFAAVPQATNDLFGVMQAPGASPSIQKNASNDLFANLSSSNTPKSSTELFGGIPTPPKNPSNDIFAMPPQNASTDLFASPPQTPSADLFAQSPSKPQAPSNDLFSAAPATPSNDLFGAVSSSPQKQSNDFFAQAPATPSNDLFDAVASPSQKQSNDLFGAVQSSPQKQSNDLFAAAPPSASNDLFGNMSNSPQKQSTDFFGTSPSVSSSQSQDNDLFDPFANISKPPQSPSIVKPSPKKDDIFDIGPPSTKQADPYATVKNSPDAGAFDVIGGLSNKQPKKPAPQTFDPFAQSPSPIQKPDPFSFGAMQQPQQPKAAAPQFDLFGPPTTAQPKRPAPQSHPTFDPFA